MIARFSGTTRTHKISDIEFIQATAYNDTIFSTLPMTILDGGTGDDRLDFANETTAVHLVISQTANDQGFYSFTQTDGDNQTVRLVKSVEQIAGTSRNDSFDIAGPISLLLAGGGNDIITSRKNSVTIDGGVGEDSLRYQTATAITRYALSGTANDDGYYSLVKTYADDSTDTDLIKNIEIIRGGDAHETMISNLGGIIFYGGKGNDVFESYNGLIDGGNDVFYGGAGSDIFKIGTGNDVFDGGAGIDYYQLRALDAPLHPSAGLAYASFTPSETADENGFYTITITYAGILNFGSITKTDKVKNVEGIIATQYADRITTNEVFSEVRGGDGADTLTGHDGTDTLYGDDGNDILFGRKGDDFLYGGKGNDNLRPEEGNDIIYGGVGNDFVDARGAGINIIDGGAGKDQLFGHTPDGDAQYNFVSFETSNTAVTIDFSAPLLQTTIRGGGNHGKYVEQYSVTAYGETQKENYSHIFGMIGSDHNDTLTGNGEKNIIFGGKGNDTIDGKGGNDVLIGSAGTNELTGGAGRDIFVISTESSIQNIHDFKSGDDKISFMLTAEQAKEGITDRDSLFDSINVYQRLTGDGRQIFSKGERLDSLFDDKLIATLKNYRAALTDDDFHYEIVESLTDWPAEIL